MNPRAPDESNQKTMAIASSGVFVRQQARGSLKQINVSLAPVERTHLSTEQRGDIWRAAPRCRPSTTLVSGSWRSDPTFRAEWMFSELLQATSPPPAAVFIIPPKWDESGVFDETSSSAGLNWRLEALNHMMEDILCTIIAMYMLGDMYNKCFQHVTSPRCCPQVLS